MDLTGARMTAASGASVAFDAASVWTGIVSVPPLLDVIVTVAGAIGSASVAVCLVGPAGSVGSAGTAVRSTGSPPFGSSTDSLTLSAVAWSLDSALTVSTRSPLVFGSLLYVAVALRISSIGVTVLTSCEFPSEALTTWTWFSLPFGKPFALSIVMWAK